LQKFSFIVKLTSVILLLTYSVSTFVGIGVNHCGCTHSQRIVMMSVARSCICSNSIETCCPHNDHYSEGVKKDDCGSDCCSLEYQYVEIDQMSVKQSNNHSAKDSSLFVLPFLSVHGWNASFNTRALAANNNSPPDDLFKISVVYLHMQLRL